MNENDNIKSVFISLDDFNAIWLLKLLFIDAMRYATNRNIDLGLERYIQIDIDDVFVGGVDTRMIPEDVDELVRLQDELSQNFFTHNNHGFKFNLGYCGYFYLLGNEIENEGDKKFIGIYFNFSF